LHEMFLTKLKLTATLIIVLGVLGAGAGWLMRHGFGGAPLLAAAGSATSAEGASDSQPAARTGGWRERVTLGGHKGEVVHLAFAADGATLVAVGANTVRLWDVAQGQEITTFEGEQLGTVHAASLSPDGKLLATASSFGDDKLNVVKLWDVRQPG